MDKFAKSTKNRKTEKGILINSEGEVVYSKNGGKDSVSMDANYRRLYEEYGELHLDHNQPSVSKDFPFPECLSVEDMLGVTERVTQADGRGNSWDEYCIKSITAEGTNGTRMTLVRGDYFTEDNRQQLGEAINELADFYDYYVHGTYANQRDFIFNNLLEESKKKYGDKETLNRIDELDKQASKQAIEKVGRFQDQDDYKKISKKIRDANCKLIISEWE